MEALHVVTSEDYEHKSYVGPTELKIRSATYVPPSPLRSFEITNVIYIHL